MKRVLTGIKPTGTPHIGNYVGAIRPAIAASRTPGVESFYFLADWHALIGNTDPVRVQRATLEIAASWLALGLDPEKVLFYRQSDIPEIPELTWLLTCVTGKGLLNRAHAYKAAVDANTAAGEDADAGVTAGLYMYPVLMAADILMFNAHAVPVGRDQVQHIEIARDLAARFNHLYGGEYFTLPEAQVEESTAVLPGLDGRKMSKSYDNVIPLWDDPKALRKKIMGIVTDSTERNAPKDPETSHLFAIYRAIATPQETEALRCAYADGIAWGDVKNHLANRIEDELGEARARYRELVTTPDRIEEVLQAGAAKARAIAAPLLERARHAVGLRRLSSAIASNARRETTDAGPRVTVKEWSVFPNFFFKVLEGKVTRLTSRGLAKERIPVEKAALLNMTPESLRWKVVLIDGRYLVEVGHQTRTEPGIYIARSEPFATEAEAINAIDHLQELCRRAASD
jgi:tryptophanyl-tRNA synthetase